MAVDASVDSLRSFVGAASTKDDALLASALQTAGAWVAERVYPASWNTDEVQSAVLMLASRLYRRRQSPEGVAGFGGEGLVIRVMAQDPDINRLLERHQDMTNVGIG